MDILLHDTGIINPNFTDDTRFVLWSSASPSRKDAGEFRSTAQSIKLKLTAINNGTSSTKQRNPMIGKMTNTSFTISMEPIVINVTGFVEVPTVFQNTSDLKDLNSIYQYFWLFQWSRGHKDLYLLDQTVPAREQLFSLYWLLQLVGKTDNGNPDSKKHLNTQIDNISFNEGVGNLSFNMGLTVYPYFG